MIYFFQVMWKTLEELVTRPALFVDRIESTNHFIFILMFKLLYFSFLKTQRIKYK
jgi:hypothetical protein